MDLMPPDLRSAIRLFPIGSQARIRDNAKVLVKYFFPAGRYTFIATEAEEQEDDVLFFGYCVSPFGSDCDEWGYTCLSELQSVRVRGLTMERDIPVPVGARTVRELLSAAA
jgi:hypothetical protein